MLRVGDEKDAKRAYDLLALLRVILPSSRQKLSVKYLYAIDHVEELQWASCAFTTMMQSISTYQKDKARSQSQIGGCLLFLQLFYIKAVSPPAGSPFLHSVTKDTVIKVFNDYRKIQKSSDHAPEGEEEFMKFEVDHIQTEMEKMMQIRVQKVDDQKKKQIVTEVYTTMLHAVYNQAEILKSSFSETRDKEEEEEEEDEELTKQPTKKKACELADTSDAVIPNEPVQKKHVQSSVATTSTTSKASFLGDSSQGESSIIYYPSREDPDHVVAFVGEIAKLAPEQCLNDSIMSIYIRYLQQETSPVNGKIRDYYFFNTFFYTKMQSVVSCEIIDKNAFNKLRKWWKGVNIFEKAYLVIPISEHEHWSLIIVCMSSENDKPRNTCTSRVGGLAILTTQ